MDHSNESKPAEIAPDLLVEQVRTELQEIDALELNDHAARFEVLHQKLEQALTSIDG